jgi:hypothetical protein
MNDNELTSMVRESVTGIRSSTPVDQIISRGHAVRTRRRVPAAAGALVVAGGAALGVTALAPHGHPVAAGQAGSRPAVVRLAAWTVVRQADGDIDITIRQLQHPAQLQATLRADGLPVDVSFSGHPGSAVCRPYTNTTPELDMSIYRSLNRTVTSNGSYLFTIHPSQLPSGAGLSITVENIKDLPRPVVALSLVHASQQCTG